MNTTNETAVQTPRQLLTELQTLMREAEQMVVGSESAHSEDALNALHSRFGAVQERIGALYEGAKQRVVAGAKCTDTAIRANPYQSLAIAAGIGLLVGVLVGRRSR